MPCQGNASEHCGDGDKLNVFKADCSAMPAVVNPSQSLCGHPDHAGLEAPPFCNATNGLDERARDLVARPTVDEQVALLAAARPIGRVQGVVSNVRTFVRTTCLTPLPGNPTPCLTPLSPGVRTLRLTVPLKSSLNGI